GAGVARGDPLRLPRPVGASARHPGGPGRTSGPDPPLSAEPRVRTLPSGGQGPARRYPGRRESESRRSRPVVVGRHTSSGRAVREFPVFVPSRGERIGAVIAVPDADPRGLVLLMPGGGGAPRAHRYAMYTKVARGLAERGIASVRMDWRGVGDSTGRAR